VVKPGSYRERSRFSLSAWRYRPGSQRGPADYIALANNFDPAGSLGPHGWNDGNSDGDSAVDLADYNVLASNFSPAGYGDAAVPEPTSLCLLLAGLLVLAGVASFYNPWSCALVSNGVCNVHWVMASFDT